AAAVGSADAMRALLDAGADPNARNEDDSTALMWSATEMPKVRLLLEHKADVNIVSRRGRSALTVAAMNEGSAEVVRFLISKGADIHVDDAIKNTAMHAAATGNATDTIRLLVDAGLDVNAVNAADFTPLMKAAQHGNVAAVRLLLSKGARPNDVSGQGDIVTQM